MKKHMSWEVSATDNSCCYVLTKKKFLFGKLHQIKRSQANLRSLYQSVNESLCEITKESVLTTIFAFQCELAVNEI